jgi:hypothetical protein
VFLLQCYSESWSPASSSAASPGDRDFGLVPDLVFSSVPSSALVASLPALGSMEIWRNNTKRVERGNQEVANALIEDEEARNEEARVELEREESGEQ